MPVKINLPTVELTELNAAVVILKLKKNPNHDGRIYMCGGSCPHIDYLENPLKACICKLKQQRNIKWYKYLEDKGDFPFHLIIEILVYDTNRNRVLKWVPVVCLGDTGDQYIVRVANGKIEGNPQILHLHGPELARAVADMALEMENEMFLWKKTARAIRCIHQALDATRGRVALAEAARAHGRIDDVHDEVKALRVQQEKEAKLQAQQKKEMKELQVAQQDIRDRMALLETGGGESILPGAPTAVSGEVSLDQASFNAPPTNTVTIPPSATKQQTINLPSMSPIKQQLSPSSTKSPSNTSVATPSSAKSVTSSYSSQDRRLSRSLSPARRKSRCASPFGCRSSPTVELGLEDIQMIDQSKDIAAKSPSLTAEEMELHSKDVLRRARAVLNRPWRSQLQSKEIAAKPPSPSVEEMMLDANDVLRQARALNRPWRSRLRDLHQRDYNKYRKTVDKMCDKIKNNVP